MTLKKDGAASFHFGNATDTGLVREHNEDYYGFFSTPLGDVFVVCDGMGGHNGGEVASRLAVETISSFFKTTMPSSPEKLLRTSIEKANNSIWTMASEQVELSGMGTTIVMLFFPRSNTGTAFVAHVGDSRIYRIRNKAITRMTQDHSKVMMLVKLGIITLEEAAYHPQKNIITRALGIASDVDVEINQIDLNKGDRYILCSDGITDLITDHEILSISEKAETQKLAEQLIEKANSRGGHDNSTVQVVDLPENSVIDWPVTAVKDIVKKVPRIKFNKRIALFATPVVLLLVILLKLTHGGPPNLTSKHHYEEYTAGDQPAYIITIQTDSENAIEFDNKEDVESITDSTFIINVADLHSSGTSTTLLYTISHGEDRKQYSLTIHNEFEQAYLNYHFIEPEPDHHPKTHITLQISTQFNNTIQCSILGIDTTQTREELQLPISVSQLRDLFGENNGIIYINAPIHISGERMIPHTEELQWEYTLPEIPVTTEREFSNPINGSILVIKGTTVPCTTIGLSNSEQEPEFSDDGSFTIPVESSNWIESVELTLEHPCYRTTVKQVLTPEVTTERFTQIPGIPRAFTDEETDLDWLCGPDSQMSFTEASSWKESKDSWEFPSEAQLIQLSSEFYDEYFAGNYFWMGGNDSTNARIYVLSRKSTIPTPYRSSGMRILLVR